MGPLHRSFNFMNSLSNNALVKAPCPLRPAFSSIYMDMKAARVHWTTMVQPDTLPLASADLKGLEGGSSSNGGGACKFRE